MAVNRFTRFYTAFLLFVPLFLSIPEGVHAFELDSLDFFLGNTWIHNGFKVDSDGNDVQGSNADPLVLSGGAGVLIPVARRQYLSPSITFYTYEYAALSTYDKTVPTSIETGSEVGDIAPLLSLIISSPYLVEFTVEDWTAWRLLTGFSPTLVFRIPVGTVDGTDAGPPAAYFRQNGRFIYPEVYLETDYDLSDRFDIGFVTRWFIPIYNLWDSGETTPFFDENMVHFGLSIRLKFGEG